MTRPFLFFPIALSLLTGCTISAKANPAIDSAKSPASEVTVTVSAPAIAPAEAVSERLQSVVANPDLISSIVPNGESVVVTLAAAPATLGGAEQYWSVCAALLPLLGSSSVTAVAIAAPDGRPIVIATGAAPACVLATSR